MARKNNLIARLRHKVTIEKGTETEDSHGEIQTTWAELLTERASIEPLVGREYFAAQQVNAERNIKVRMRYNSLIATMTSKMRVIYGTRIFDVQSVINVEEKNREMLIMTIEDA